MKDLIDPFTQPQDNDWDAFAEDEQFMEDELEDTSRDEPTRIPTTKGEKNKRETTKKRCKI
jgi:hypothetical protein